MRITGETMERALINANMFISADLETTGFSLNSGSEILEIGAVLINTETKKILKTFNKLIKPRNGKISKKITQINNITNEMVKDAEYVETVLKEFSNFIGNYPIVFHNASFDWDRFLDPLFKKQGIYKSNDIIDTLPLTKICLPELSKSKLEVVCEYFGYTIKNQHRAIADAKATGAIAIKYKEILRNKYKDIKDEESKQISGLNNQLPIFKIKSINCWKKAKLKRIYVLTSWGNLFYDLNKNNWYVANTNYDANINFETVQDKFLKISHLTTMSNIEEYFNKNIQEKVS